MNPTNNNFSKTLDTLEAGLDSGKWISAKKDNSLQVVKKSGRFIRVLSTLLRVLFIDVYSHVRVNKVATAILANIQKDPRNIDNDTRERAKKLLRKLDKKTKGKYHKIVEETIGKIPPQTKPRVGHRLCDETLSKILKDPYGITNEEREKAKEDLRQFDKETNGNYHSYIEATIAKIPPQMKPRDYGTMQDVEVPAPAAPPRKGVVRKQPQPQPQGQEQKKRAPQAQNFIAMDPKFNARLAQQLMKAEWQQA